MRATTKNASNARQLGINLRLKSEEELFKWFLACLLFGKPIQTEIAERAWRELMKTRLTSPTAVSRAGWDKLVSLLDRAHYVRYDFSTATKLLEVCQELKRRYGTLINLLAQAETPTELSRRLQEFKHIGARRCTQSRVDTLMRRTWCPAFRHPCCIATSAMNPSCTRPARL